MNLGELLAQIEQRADRATLGPWGYYWGWNTVHTKNPVIDGKCVIVADYCHLHMENRKPEQIRDDMAFHSAARQDVPALIRALRKAIEQREEVAVDAFGEKRFSGWSEKCDAELAAILEEKDTK